MFDSPDQDRDAFEEAMRKIMAMGHSPQHEEVCEGCSTGMSDDMKEHVIQCTNAHNNTKELFGFIQNVTGGNASSTMRCGTYAMKLLEGFQELADDDTDVGSHHLREVIAAYIAQMLAKRAEEVIKGVNNGSDKSTIKALDLMIQVSMPRTDEEIEKLKQGLE